MMISRNGRMALGVDSSLTLFLQHLRDRLPASLFPLLSHQQKDCTRTHAKTVRTARNSKYKQVRLLNVSTDRLVSTKRFDIIVKMFSKHFLFFRRESWIDKDVFPIKDQEMIVIKCLLLYFFLIKKSIKITI